MDCDKSVARQRTRRPRVLESMKNELAREHVKVENEDESSHHSKEPYIETEENPVELGTTFVGATTIVRRQTLNGVLFRSWSVQGTMLAVQLLILLLAVPTAAIDYDGNAIVSHYRPSYIPPEGNQARVFVEYHVPRLAVGAASTVLLFISGYMIGAVRTLLGPLMGITSILWFIMRNDPAVKPGLSWIMFGAWSALTLMYLSIQCYRVAFHQLYILLTMAFAGGCLCLIALVQKSSIPGGLVTAIPPCTAFAAYAVAFFFPDRRQVPQVLV